jgi:hypothetical protein
MNTNRMESIESDGNFSTSRISVQLHSSRFTADPRHVTCHLSDPPPPNSRLSVSDHRKPFSRPQKEDAPSSCNPRSLALNMSSDYEEDSDVTQLRSVSRPGVDSPTLTLAALPATPTLYLPRPDDDPNENDSAYEEDSLLRDDTKTLATYITEYRYEFGRRYHAFRDGAYWVGAGEAARCPPPDPGFARIISIGGPMG